MYHDSGGDHDHHQFLQDVEESVGAGAAAGVLLGRCPSTAATAVHRRRGSAFAGGSGRRRGATPAPRRARATAPTDAVRRQRRTPGLTASRDIWCHVTISTSPWQRAPRPTPTFSFGLRGSSTMGACHSVCRSLAVCDDFGCSSYSSDKQLSPAECHDRKASFTAHELNWTEQVDPVTPCVGWPCAQSSTYFVLITCRHIK